MARITVSHDNQTVKTVELAAGAVTIGRAADNKIQLNDKTISAHHAQIVTYFNASYVGDLGSTNGTFVNGKKVQMHVVQAGDVITIGMHQFQVAADEVAASAVA